MQVFVPHVSYYGSAWALDLQRLGKQIIEARQIHLALVLPPGEYGWQSHPATLAWQGHECALFEFAEAFHAVWRARRAHVHSRPHKAMVNMRRDHLEHVGHHGLRDCATAPGMRLERPPWWGDPEIHDSHKANLVRKDRDRYGAMFPTIEPRDGYVWPVIRSE